MNDNIDLEVNKEYPVGTMIDFNVHGFHNENPSRFTVLTRGGTVIKDCLYEGYGDLFNHRGQILTDVAFFRLQDATA